MVRSRWVGQDILPIIVAKTGQSFRFGEPIDLGESEDHKEGARAFVEKRTPVFRGR